MVRTKFIVLTLILLAPGIIAGSAAAQSATPAAVACTTTPRTDAELASLAATPPAAATPDAVAAFPAGEQADKTTSGKFQETLDQLQACQLAGNINAVLALYTDAYVSNVALAPESVTIVAATPGAAAQPAGTPESVQPMALALISAHLGADGSIAALVLYGSNLHVLDFIQQAGIWRIDAAANFVPSAASAPAAPVQAAVAAAAAKLGVDADLLKLLYTESRDWPDSSLGCPEPGKLYAQVITPGWQVVISGSGRVLDYRTGSNQTVALCRSFGG